MNFYYKDLIDQDREILISDDQVHHFKNVQRGRLEDKCLIFNGNGLIGQGKVTNLSKKEITLTINHVDKFKKYKTHNLIIGTPKKEYVETILRSATQMGVPQITFMNVSNTPKSIKWTERMDKILISSMIQSENAWFPEVRLIDSFDKSIFNELKCLVFSTEDFNKDKAFNSGSVDTLVIGPEGGFSAEEISFFAEHPKCQFIRCNTPIMKAEVAVSYCTGLASNISDANS